VDKFHLGSGTWSRAVLYHNNGMDVYRYIGGRRRDYDADFGAGPGSGDLVE